MFTRFGRWGFKICISLGAMLAPAVASAQPVLSVSPESINVMTYQGSNPPQQVLEIRNVGNRAMKWSVVPPTASWLSVSGTSGTNGGTITLKYSTSSLAAGTYQTSFTVSIKGATSSVTVPVQLAVATPPAQSPTKLTVSCPANMSVPSSNGGAVVVNYSPTSSGGTSPVSVTASPASGSSFEVGTRVVSVVAQSADGQSASCSFSVTVTYTAPPPPPPTLTVSCPANMSVPSSNGSAVPVTYSATASGGLAPVTVSLSPVSGSLFAVGTTFVTATARSADGQNKSCSFSVAVTYTAPPPPPPPSAVGPQSTITCPSGAVTIYPGTSIQTVVDTNPGNTTFCLKAGTYTLRSSITPKSGDTFVGEYGAILDGTGWSTSDDTQAAFRAHNQDIDYVTIRNLVIRNMPQRGIHAYYWMSNNWTVEYNEIASNTNVGIVFPAASTIRNNYIHHNVYGGYMTDRADNTTLEGNEIAYNGTQQKVSESANVTFRNNFVHHNAGAGIWYDSDNTGALVEGNRVEDNGTHGIWFEIGSGIIIRNNTIRRSADTGVFISTSKNAQVYSNTLENNYRGVTYFVNCPSVGQGAISFDLANNTTHDNSITVGTQQYAFASVFNYSGCTSTQVAPYLNGSKGLTFTNNTYKVPSTSGQYWYWSLFKYWNEWQGLGHDLTGSVSQ